MKYSTTPVCRFDSTAVAVLKHIPVSNSLHHCWLVVLLTLSRLLPVVSPEKQSDQSAKPQTDQGNFLN